MLVRSQYYTFLFISTIFISSGLNLIYAFIMVKVEAGKDEEVLQEVKKLVETKQAVATYGVYDLHIEASFKDVNELDRFIFEKVRLIPGVKETVTMIASKGDTNGRKL